MKDAIGSIIYVGKAKNLKRRVQSYFQKSASHSPKVIKLVNNIRDFDFILTDTEFEAFMLECKLIKDIKPFFNKKMKNPQAYTFITVSMDDEIPRLAVSNETKGQTCFFGPYISKHTVEKAVQGLKEFYQIDCSNPMKRKTPCLNYSLGMCMGMCFRDEAAEQYRTIIHKISHLLDGTDKSVLDEMKQMMIDAAENLDFAMAAKYRDYIEVISFLLYKEEVIGFTEENQNIAVIEYLTDKTFKLFLIRRNQVLFSEKFTIESTSVEELKNKMMNRFKSPCSFLEMSKEEIDEAQIIYSYLQSGSCKFTIIPDKWLSSDQNDLAFAVEKLIGQSPASMK